MEREREKGEREENRKEGRRAPMWVLNNEIISTSASTSIINTLTIQKPALAADHEPLKKT